MSQACFWIVNPDGMLARRWESLLRREGWQAVVETDLARLAADMAPNSLGMLLLDWNALRPPAAEAIKRFKTACPGVSVILTSAGSLGPDRVVGALEAGADDHFLTQVDDKLLLAKLKAHLRRLLPSLASALDVLKSPSGGLKLDRSRQEAWVRSGRDWRRVESLTPTEFQFLTLFLEQPGRVLERRYIVETVWQGQGAEIRPGTVDKHIESLRRKLGRFGSTIRTVYGVGYAFREA